MSTRYFLALDGVKGDSLNSTYKGWFEVSGFDIDLAGAGASMAAFSPLTLTLNSSTGLAPLLALAASGDHLNGATLVGVTDGATQTKVYQLDLADVLVVNVAQHAEAFTEAGPALTLDYGKIELETFTPDGTGGVIPEGQFGFDLTTNTGGITVPSAEPGGSVVSSPKPIDYFMLIDGLTGGSLDDQHKGWFEISGVDLDMEKIAAGDFASLNVIMHGGAGLGDVMTMAATGAGLSGSGVLRGVHIEGFTAGINPVNIYDLTLANVAVSDVAMTDATDYSLSLEYGKIALVTHGIDGSGNPVKNGEFGYDVTNHAEIPPFSLGLNMGNESSSASGVKYFLALDAVAGDLALALMGPGANGLNSDRWFEVNRFDIDVEGVGLPGPSGIVKKAAFSPLTLTLDSNTALAPLLTMAATNDFTAIKAATLIGVKSDGQTVSYRLDLGTLLVTNVEDMAGGGLTASLDFGQIKLWTFTQSTSGVISHANDFTWDVQENSEDVSDMPSVRGGGIAASPEPATYFMLIDGLNGGSTDSQHKGWFEISSFDFDLENPSTFNPKGPPVLGKPQFSSLDVTLPQEAGLADLMALAATGELVKGVRIEGFTGGTTPAKVYELTLADVAATKVVDGEDGGYNLSLDYGKIALVTKNEAGAQTRQFSYDIETNSAGAFNPSSLALSPDSSGGPVTPAKYYLALDGMKGDSLNSTYKGWFEISDFDIDLDNVFAGTPGGPGGPGNPDFSPLTLRLNSNAGLAPLLALAATGQHLNGATLVGVTAGLQDKVYQLDLADVLVTKVEDGAAAGLTLSIDYGKIELDTFTQNGTGGVVPEGQFGFDRTTNTGGVTVPSVLPSGSVDPSPEPATYFMLIDGVNGGSTDAQHKGWFEITGVDLDVAHMRLPASGEANFSPLIVTPENEAGLAGVMDLAATGGHVKGVRIEGFTGGTRPGKVYELTLADVAATKVVDGEGDGYSLSLDYGKIALVTNGIDATGAPTKNGEFGYDVVNNTEIAPFSLALNPGHEPVADAQSITTDEDTATAVTLSGSDVDGDSLTFTVTSGPAHGTLSGTGANFIYTPNPNYNGPDSFTYVANDGWTDSAVASVSLTVNGAEIAPTITSNGGGVTAALSVVENITAVTTVTATDQDVGQTLSYSISGGADASKFTIGPSTGALSFVTAPNFELPTDVGGNNVYDVIVQASDGHGGSDTQAIAVSVTDQNEPPTFSAVDMAGQLLLGVNLAGAEFGTPDHVPGVFGTDYIYPTHTEIDYYAAKGMSVVRLPFLWERLQHSENGPLDGAELARLDDVVNYTTGKGLKIEIEPHNYGYGFGALIGSAQTPNAAFADLWGKLAFHYQSNPSVIFGLMNEPHDQSASVWLGSANAAIAAIRAAGASQEILVPGSYYDGAWTWTTSDNAAVIGTGVQDPAHNFAFEVHQYLDADGSGKHAGVVSADIGVERLTAITQWAEATSNHLFLGEVGVATDQTSLTALDRMLSYMHQHTDVWQGVTYWAGGPWWDNYMFSIEPQNGVDKPQMAILMARGADTAAASILENTTAVTTVMATDPDTGQTLSYSISGGADASKFTIGPSTGALSFVTAPNFELPTDVGGNNVYDVTVQVSDGAGGIDTQSIAVTVTNVKEVNGGTVAAWDFNWQAVASGDFNGDGTDDVVWQNTGGVLGEWLMSDGEIAGTLRLPDMPGWHTVASGDFNGDGVTDIMWQNASGLVGEWFMGNGTRQGTAAIQNMAGWNVAAIGDFNGDHITDVIWDNGNGVLGGWLMNDSGQIGGTLQLPFFPGWNKIGTGDYNHDGVTDILWQNADGLVGEWFMGNGTRQGTATIQNMAGWNVVASGDFNGDGTGDVLWRHDSGVTGAWFMHDGRILATTSYGSTAGNNVVASGDFDNNGVSDVMWQDATTGTISTWMFDLSGLLI